MASQSRSHDHSPKASGSSIYHAKQLCFQHIEDCVAQKNANFAAHARALEQMLQLWAKHSGVDARKGMSLDDRLKDHPDLKTTLIGLLELIEQKTTQALFSPDVDDHDDPENAPARINVEEDDDIDPEELLIKRKWRSYSGTPWETVGASVDMVIELTAMIRKSTVRNSSLPAHFHRPDDYFADYAKILARKWFKDARRSLTDQLGDSVFVRRRHMLYKLKHEEKISYPATHLPPVPAEPTVTLRPAAETIPAMERLKQTNPRVKVSRPTVPIFADLTPSSTNLSQLDRNKLAQRSRNIKALSGITEGSVSVEETSFSYMYPDPPTLGEGQRHAVCPYCSGFLPASKLTKAAWRKHLHEDLQPYVCISEKCQDPVQFFSNSEQWLQHMKEAHGKDWPQWVHMVTWYCERGHGKLEFNSEAELRRHLVPDPKSEMQKDLAHDHESLEEAHVNALIRRNWGMGRPREGHVCPFCESTPSNIVPRMNDKDEASLLFRHIGDHLIALALFSLPSLNIDPASDGQCSSSGAHLPTNENSNAHAPGNNQAVDRFDEDLDGSLTFDDDPHGHTDVMDSEETIIKGRISGVPSHLDASLEWKFVSSEQETPELDPVLQTLRFEREVKQQVTKSREPLKRASLSEQIQATAVESVFDERQHRYFFPKGSMDSLITKESVIDELKITPFWRRVISFWQAQPTAEVESLAEFISISARKLFAITILVDSSSSFLQESMESFRAKNVTDLSLPLQESWFKKNYGHKAGGDRGSDTDESDDSSNYTFAEQGLWPGYKVRPFCRSQQQFLAPVFSTSRLSYEFEQHTILPFTERGPEKEYGAYEYTTRYRIHERHIDEQIRDVSRPYYFTLRELDRTSTKAWKEQVKRLSRVSSLNHGHIVRFLAAFRRGQTCGHFMFEWASGGNLRNLWHTFHQPKLTSGLVKAAFLQMYGLASAIRSVHHLSESVPLYHGYLEPEYIFWFNNRRGDGFGTLKIDGWIFGERIRTKSGPWVDEVDLIYGPPNAHQRYQAPELESVQPSSRTRSFFLDIWSMGCIMLEFLIWIMYGVNGLDRFRPVSDERTFFHHARDRNQEGKWVATVDPVVLKWMDHMAADPACEIGTTALGKLLDLIRTRLLVVKLPRRARPAPSTESQQVPAKPHSSVADQSHQTWERCTSSELEERMREISGENETERYWLAAEPKPPPEI